MAEPGSREVRARWLHEQPEVAATGAEVTVLEGPPAGVLVNEARRTPDTVVCMAMRGRGPVRETLFGSVSGAVLRTVGRPVLLVGPRAPKPAGDWRARRLVVTLDGSETSEAILPAAAEWARLLGARVEVLSVIYPPGDPEARAVTRLPPEADERYDFVTERARGLEAEGLDVDWQVLAGADPAATILEHVRHVPWLVAMATHGRTGLAAVLVGSVTSEVVRQHAGPVLVVRPPRLRG